MHAEEPASDSTTLSPRGALLALLGITCLVALPIRLYIAADAAMISRDGAGFIWYAQGLSRDAVAEMREQAQHPLYPAMLLGGHGVFGSIVDDPVRGWVISGVAVTLAGGLLVVVAVYALTAQLFDRRIGLIAALMAALTGEFCQLSADALTDMPHLALYLFGLSAAGRAMLRRQVAWLAVAGMLSGLAFLARPEGAEVAVVGSIVVLAGATGWSWRRRTAGLLLLGLGAAAVASPYMLVTGKLVQKKSVGKFFGAEAEADVRSGTFASPSIRPLQGPGGTGLRSTIVRSSPVVIAGATDPSRAYPLFRALGKIVEDYSRSLRVVYLLPVIAWLVRRRDVPGEPVVARLIAVALVAHLIILFALILRFDYWELFSIRHVMVLTGLTLPFSAAGVTVLARRLDAQRQMFIATTITVGLALPTVPWMFETRHAGDGFLRAAGEWIRTQSGDRTPRVMTTRHRVAFYADGVHVWSPLDADVDAILAEARYQKPGWLVFDEKRMLRENDDFFAELERSLQPGEQLERVAVDLPVSPRDKSRAILYHYRPPP